MNHLRYIIVACAGTLLLFLSAQPIAATPFAVLQLDEAYQNILEVNLRLKSSEAKICAAAGEREQAALWPNPTLEASLSDIGRGPGRHDDNDNNEIFIGLMQVVELGGKRSARMRVAEAGQCIADWDYEIQKKLLFAQLMHAFIDMAAAQEGVSLSEKQGKIAQQILDSVKDKVSSGKTSAIEEKKAEIAVKQTRVAFAKQQAMLKKAKQALVTLWNNHPPAFDSVAFALNELKPPPRLDVLVGTLDNHPARARAIAESTKAAEVYCLERSLRIPDIALQIGVSTQQFVQQPALAVGIEIPLPIFDRNQGNIDRASYEKLEAMYDQMDLETNLKAELTATYEEWMGSYDQAVSLRDSVLPSAEEAMQLAQEGYAEGMFDYLHLLDANSTLISVREQYLEAITDYHHKRAEVFRLTAICSCDAL